MMWIAHKAKDGDTLTTIAKQYKNKDSKAILQYPGNKKVTARLKKGEAMKKGDVVWVLNPKSKVYLVNNGKCSVLLEECGYKATLKEINRVMDRVLSQQQINYDAACARHDAQIAINKSQNFVFAFVDSFNSVDEPMAQWRKAKAAYKKLGAIVKGRDYKGFQKAAIDCEIAVSTYNRDVHAWVYGLIDVTETTTTVMKGVRTAGEFCAFAAAVTICAPASLAAGVVVSASASATVGLVFDGYEQIGRAAVGEKQRSPSELAQRMLTNAVTGAAGALIVGGVLKAAGPWLTKTITSSAFLNKYAVRMAGKIIPERVIQAETRAVQQWLSKQGGKVPIQAYFDKLPRERIMVEALKKFMMRMDMGTLLKAINGKAEVAKLLFGWIQSKPTELKGNDTTKIGAAAGQHLIDKGAADGIMQDVVNKKMKEFRKCLYAVILVHAQKMEKKEAA